MALPTKYLTIKRVREHRQSLEDFRAAYNSYLQAGFPGRPDLRDQVLALIAPAHLALRAAEVDLAILPPPWTSGDPVWRGLANTAFLHERPGYRPSEGRPGGAQLTYTEVLDQVAHGISFLDEKIKELERRRRTPGYWVDRAARFLLGGPAYVLSMLIDVPKWKIEGSAVGAALRTLTAVAEGVGIYAAGRAVGWW
jgi:hypothetical protein